MFPFLFSRLQLEGDSYLKISIEQQSQRSYHHFGLR